MKNYYLFILLVITNLIFDVNFSPATENITDRSESPYFSITTTDFSIESFPLLSTSVDVHISGVIADVTVRQVYRNGGKTPIEAVYVFPASTRAAVYSMTMEIADRLLKAEIYEKEEAKETYNKAKEEGKSASLLEQERPNVFQMSVANIMPGDTIIIEMKYTELLIPKLGIYEFIYPTVVGPRYSSANDTDTNSWTKGPYTKEGVKPNYTFDINIELLSGVPLSWIECKSHNMELDKISENHVNLKMDTSDIYSGNKDFILKYQLTSEKIQTGLILSDKGQDKYFLLMVQPPKSVDTNQIPPREYIFVLDVSGSMNGFPTNVSLDLLQLLTSEIRETDLFNFILFSDTYGILSPESVPATQENFDKAEQFYYDFEKGGGTELKSVMKKALDLEDHEGYSKTIVVMTDGFVNADTEVMDLIKRNLNKSNLFAFGIGKGVNHYLIEGMARAGSGEPFICTDEDDAARATVEFKKYLQSPVMTKMDISFGGFMTEDVEPVNIPDVFAQRPILVYGKWKGSPSGTITVSGISGRTKLRVEIPLNKFSVYDTSSALKYLWARNKLFGLQDYAFLSDKDKFKDEITELGLEYQLLTKYTSFVAVDYIVRADKKPERVNQPLPLPEGVPDGALSESQKFTSRYKTQSSSSYPVKYSSPHSGGGGGVSDPLVPLMVMQPFFIGPFAGFNYSSFSNIDLPENSYTTDLNMENETGYGFSAGLTSMFFLGNERRPWSDIELKVFYDSKSAHSESGGDVPIPQPGNTTLEVPVKYNTDFRFSSLNLSAGMNVLLFETTFFVGMRFGAGISLSSNSTQLLTIVSQDSSIKFMDEPGVNYMDNYRTMVINDGGIPDFNSFQMYFTPLAGYDLLLGRMFIRFNLGYDIHFLPLTKGSDWKCGNIFAGAGFIFAL